MKLWLAILILLEVPSGLSIRSCHFSSRDTPVSCSVLLNCFCSFGKLFTSIGKHYITTGKYITIGKHHITIAKHHIIIGKYHTTIGQQYFTIGKHISNFYCLDALSCFGHGVAWGIQKQLLSIQHLFVISRVFWEAKAGRKGNGYSLCHGQIM